MENWENKSLENIEETHEGVNYTEEWMDVVGYEGHYMVSNFGRIKALKRAIIHGRSGSITMPERILSQKLRNDGYNEVNLALDKKHTSTSVSICVGIHFLSNPENLTEINHKRGIKTDNRFHQIEWSTPSDNMLHSYRELGRKHTVGFGHKNPNYRYFINTLTGIYYTYLDLSFYFDVSVVCLRRMVCNNDIKVRNFVKV